MSSLNQIKLFVSDLSHYLDLQRYMPWSLLWTVILRSDVVVCFVDIDGIVDHHVLSCLYIITSHIESLNIKRSLSTGWMSSLNQISRKLCMKFKTQRQKCTMKLRSRQNTSNNLTSGERLRQLKLIVYFSFSHIQ
jgi:hypothetical protein